jgi:amidophosphoribosyltransferase
MAAEDSEKADSAARSGEVLVEAVRRGLRPRAILTRQAFDNAIAVVMALGGSTNAVLHLLAIAHSAGVPLALDDFEAIRARVPLEVLEDVIQPFPTFSEIYGAALKALAEALLEVRGAYSILVLSREGIFAVRDPNGIRPLSLGTREGSPVVASETCALDLIGATFSCELRPGDFVRIDNGHVTHLPRLAPRPVSRCVFELVYFARPDSMLFGESVDRVRRELGRQLGREQPAPGGEVVFSVPDSSNAMALGFSEASGIKLEYGLIRNHYVGRTFINPTQALRQAKVKIKFNPVREVIHGKSVVVVDDSLVRGNTSKELVQMIRAAGAREVHLRLGSPPITGPCLYGIDTPTREELIAATHSIDEIQQFLGVDSLGYLSLEGMLRAAGPNNEYCHACFSGQYPTTLPGDLIQIRHASPLVATPA